MISEGWRDPIRACPGHTNKLGLLRQISILGFLKSAEFPAFLKGIVDILIVYAIYDTICTKTRMTSGTV